MVVEAFISLVVRLAVDKPRTIESMVIRASERHGIPSETALRIAKCESNLNPDAKNPISSATGVYQFTIGTWEYTGMPGDRTDPVANINAFMILYKKHPSWWVCR